MKVHSMEFADPHEQYLWAVFESCNDFNQGGLSAAGLQELCEKLQLQDSCDKLTKCLLGEYKTRVLFHEFKDGLLKLLDSMECGEKTDGELSPGREVSPKYTSGKKKYGRRSRPDKNDNDESSSDNLHTSISQIHSASTDDSSSEEAVPKKRRTRGTRRKDRKSSLDVPVKSEGMTDGPHNASSANAMNEVEHLVTAWSSVSGGLTDSLTSDDLVKVFQCVGLERGSEEAAQCVFEKLGVEDGGRITLQELLEIIRSGDTWSKDVKNSLVDMESTQKSISMDFVESSGVGFLTGASLIEHWENAGVPGPSSLLQNLGYSPSHQIDLSSLIATISEEIKGFNVEVKSTRRSGSVDPHLSILRANFVLQNLYIQSLKTAMEHVNAEKEKLRSDVTEANQRALLLAQEVDEHHSKLEHSTQQQVKVLEQRHTEKMRELTKQAKAEQDNLMSQNLALERRLSQLESDEAKTKATLADLELENKLLEQEHRVVVDQLAAAQKTKEKLEKDLENVSVLQQKVSEMESTMSENDVLTLLERIQVLEKENTDLRDRNDELSVEVEDLTMKLLNASIKRRNPSSVDHSMDENVGGGSCSGGGGGTKRRGDSFALTDSAEDSGGDEGSPRLGKVRKCSHVKDYGEESTSSVQELQIDGEKGGGGDESVRQQRGTSSAAPDSEDMAESKDGESFKIVPFSKELEQADGETTLPMQLSDSLECDATLSPLERIREKLRKYDKNLEEEVMTTFEELLRDKSNSLNDSNTSTTTTNNNNSTNSGNDDCNDDRANDREAREKLETRCKELETSLELLREEYERTEDYWSEKLEEERVYFEEEQKLSDKKYSELLEKILDYEEMLKNEKVQRQRLETIEEKDNFEKQVADMEQECEDLRRQLADTIAAKEAEVEKLKTELSTLKVSQDRTDSAMQASEPMGQDLCDEVRISEDDQTSHGKSHGRKSKGSHSTGKQTNCKQCSDVKKLHETKLKYEREVDAMREEKQRIYQEINEKKQILQNYSAGDSCSGGSSKVQNFQLEQRYQTLLVTLKQQQKQTDDILKNTWKQHKAEVNDLKSVLKMTEDKLRRQTKVIQEQLNKLTKTDLLVKDLFVENAFLISSIQKLEQQQAPVPGGPSK